MKQSNPFSEFFASNDFTKNFALSPTLPFDMKSLMEMQRKNMQALTEAQKVAMDSMQAITQRQSEILSQMVEDNSSIAQEIMTEGTPEEKISKNADLFKKSYEKTIVNFKELSDMVNKSNTEASDIISKRVSASLTELKGAVGKQKKAA